MTREILFEGRYRRFIRKDGWEYLERVHSNEVVVLIPVTPDGRVVFVEQYRIPVEKKIIEFPAGLVHDLETNHHETLEETARRELVEETGYEAGRLERIIRAPANSALATDMLTVFFASGLRRVGPGGGDPTEAITVHEVPRREVDSWLEAQKAQDKYVDPKVYSGLYYLNQVL